MIRRLLEVDVKAMEKGWEQIKTFLDQAKQDEQNTAIALDHDLHSPLVYLRLVVCKVDQSVGQGCSGYLYIASKA